MSQSHSKLMRWVMLLLAALIISFIVIGWLAGRNRQQLPQVTLKDGRIVQLAAVTVGPQHGQFSPAFRNIFFNFMPAGVKKRLGPTYNASFGFQHNGIALWLMCYDPAIEQYIPGAIDRIVVVDSHGCELESTGSGATSDGIHHATVINLSNFPRDLDQITCQLLAPGSSNSVGQITIANPIKTSSVHWSPTLLPTLVTNGNLTVRLNRLPRKNYAPEFVVFEGGQPTKAWSLRESHFEDAFGNAGPDLCRKQSAWKFKTRFVRNETATFSSNELWRLPPFKLPAAGACITLNLTNKIGTNEVIVRHIIGPGAYNFSNAVFIASTPWTNGMGSQFGVMWVRGISRNYLPVTTRSANQTTLLVSPNDLQWPREMLVRARFDDRLVAVASSGPRDGTAAFFDLNWLVVPEEIPPINAQLEVELIIQNGLEFDFLVAPEDAVESTANPASRQSFS